MPKLEFFFDFGSPYSYLAHTQLPTVIGGSDVDIIYRPVDILRLMELAGNRPTTLECKNKRRYAGADLDRWATHYGVKMGRNPYLRHMKLEPLLQGAIVAIEQGVGEQYISAIFKGIYADALNLDEENQYVEALSAAGLDGAALLAARGSDALAADLAHRTEEAVERGLFGLPSMVFDGNLYFGNDRLQFVAQAIAASAKSR